MTTRSNQCNRGTGTFEEFSHDMERVFDSLLGRTVGTILRPATEPRFSPSLDVIEQEDAFLVSVDLPGINPEQVKVEMHEGKLSISGNRESVTQSGEGKTYHRVERISGEFKRVIAVPSDVDVENIDASYEHGVLTVALPKTVKPQPKQIQIRTSPQADSSGHEG